VKQKQKTKTTTKNSYTILWEQKTTEIYVVVKRPPDVDSINLYQNINQLRLTV